MSVYNKKTAPQVIKPKYSSPFVKYNVIAFSSPEGKEELMNAINKTAQVKLIKLT